MNRLQKITTLKMNPKKITIMLFALCAVSRVWLAFANDYMPVFRKILTVIEISCPPVSLYYVFAHAKFSLKLKSLIFIMLPIYYWMICGFQGNLTLYFTFITGVIFFLFEDDEKSEIFEFFYQIVLFCNIISLMVWFCYVLRLNIGFEIVPYYADHSADYIKWGIFAIFHKGNSLRLCGIFNEPGGLGTLCAFLYIARNRYSKRWENLIMLLTAALTFSFAAYLLIYMYLYIMFLFRVERKDMLPRIITNTVLCAVLLWLFLNIPNINWGNEQLNHLAQRFAITENGFAGDNRSTQAYDYYFDEFMTSEDKWNGRGYNYKFSASGVLTGKTLILQFGLIKCGIWFVLWAVLFFIQIKRNLHCWLFFCLFMLSVYQRPAAITGLYGYVCLFGGGIWMQKQSQKSLLQC